MAGYFRRDGVALLRVRSSMLVPLLRSLRRSSAVPRRHGWLSTNVERNSVALHSLLASKQWHIARRTSKLKLLPRLLFRAVDPATLRNSSLHKLDDFTIIASFDRHF